MYFKKQLLPPKVIQQIKQANHIDDKQFDDNALEYERMALGLIENKLRSNTKLEYNDSFKQDMVMNYVVGKFFQGSSLNEMAVDRFENFYTTLNSIYDSEEEYYLQTAPGIMVFD